MKTEDKNGDDLYEEEKDGFSDFKKAKSYTDPLIVKMDDRPLEKIID